MKKGQIGTEYLILVGFIVFVLVTVLGLAVYYSSNVSDQIKFDQLQNFAIKIVSSAEQVFYAGEPSKVVINAYLPEGVESLEILSNDIVFNVSTSSGVSVVAFKSDVPLSGSLTATAGVKRISISATSSGVVISEG